MNLPNVNFIIMIIYVSLYMNMNENVKWVYFALTDGKADDDIFSDIPAASKVSKPQQADTYDVSQISVHPGMLNLHRVGDWPSQN